MAIIGIDLGTTNSLAAVWQKGDVKLIHDHCENILFPSVVAIDIDGNILTGHAAKEEELLHPERCASNFKRFMGTEKVYHLADRTFTPEELSALILRKIKETAEEYLQEEVTEAIISVPAYFNNDQRYATKLAAELAGIYCERIINEPSAAALTGRQMDSEEEQCLLVFDFGGGTLDVSIVDCFENIIEITAIAGDNHLGGTDFDQAIAMTFCLEHGIDWNLLKKTQQIALLYESKRVKEGLSVQDEIDLAFNCNGNHYITKLTTDKLFHIGQSLFRRIKNVISKAVMDSQLDLDDITGVLLAGGSSKMPAVQIFLSRLFGRDIIVGKDPDLLIARGLGIYTGIKERNEEVKDILMTDVCPFSLGIEIIGDDPEGPGKMCMMIERNNILPCRVTKTFVTTHDFQEELCFRIYQGENYQANQNLKIGELYIAVPKALAGMQKVSVTFTYNINGILEVDAVSESTKEAIHTTIVSGYRHLSVEQIASKKESLASMQFLSQEEENEKAILSIGERLYAQSFGSLREYIDRTMQYYHYMQNTKSPIAIRKAGRNVLQRFLDIEMKMVISVFYEEEFDDK